MTLSRAEFLRLLPGAAGPCVEEEDGTLAGTGGAWRIRLTPLPEVRLGALALPRFQVEVVLPGYTPEEERAFLTRFHTQFRRGGG